MHANSGMLYACALLMGLAAAGKAADYAVLNTANNGPGSLHQAIADANATPGLDRIVFNIPGTGVQRISVNATALPAITDPVIIDGYTQPGARPNSLSIGSDAAILIHIDARGPASSATQYGIRIEAGGSSIRGLCLTGFRQTVSSNGAAGAAIYIRSGAGSRIAGNFLGVLPDGKTAGDSPGEPEAGSLRGDGVFIVESAENIVGGSSPESRNVIAGSANAVVVASSSPGNRILGNYIGLDASGTERVGNTSMLLSGESSNPTVLGAAGGGGNVIAGNIVIGITTRQGFLATSGVTVQANLIGFAANGRDRRPNPGSAITVYGNGILIGGAAPAEGNRITVDQSAATPPPAIYLSTSRRNPIMSNQIVTTGKAVDLGAPYNDLGDNDQGPNDRQNFPIIVRGTYGVSGDPGAGTIEAALNSHPSTEYTLQFFLNSKDDSELLGTTTAVTDSQGNARVTFPFRRPAGEPLPEDSYFTATATDPAGNTSEYFPRTGAVQLANISTRGFVGVDADILIGGFIIRSDRQKRIAVRALGPSLDVPDRLQDPSVALFDSAGDFVAGNDDWKTGGQQQEIMLARLAPGSDAESVVLATLSPGTYTVHLSGINRTSGNALMELYDLDALGEASGRLLNISTRGFVSRGDNLLIGGVIVHGSATVDVVGRAIGPDLASQGVSNALQDPLLELRDASGELLAQNDNWRQDQDGTVPPGLEPNDDRDAVIVRRLPPGIYTAIVRGKGDATGVALVEFYDIKN